VCTILNDGQPDFFSRIEQALELHRQVVVAQRLDASSGKLLGLSPALVTRLRDLNVADTILVEADGAARKPLKAPAAHEPVIPLGSDLCIGVMGLDAVYRPLTESNVHRHDIFSRITKLRPRELVTPKHMVSLAMAPNGLFKGSPPDSKLAVVLNKSDIPDGHNWIAEFESILHGEQRARNYSWFAGSIQQGHLNQINTATSVTHDYFKNPLEYSYQF